MKATILEYPTLKNNGVLVIETNSKMPKMSSDGYGNVSHTSVEIEINLSKIPARDVSNMYFTKYTLSSGKDVNIGGNVKVKYSCGNTISLHGSYINNELLLN